MRCASPRHSLLLQPCLQTHAAMLLGKVNNDTPVSYVLRCCCCSTHLPPELTATRHTPGKTHSLAQKHYETRSVGRALRKVFAIESGFYCRRSRQSYFCQVFPGANACHIGCHPSSSASRFIKSTMRLIGRPGPCCYLARYGRERSASRPGIDERRGVPNAQ